MPTLYSVSINNDEDYPFKQPSGLFAQQQVRIIFPLKSDERDQHFQKCIYQAAALQKQNPSIIKLLSAQELRPQRQIILAYEQIPFNITEICNRKLSVKRVHHQLMLLGQFLLENRIQINLETRFFGITKSKQLRYLLLPNYIKTAQSVDLQKESNSLQQKISQFLMNILKCDVSNVNEIKSNLQDDKTSQKASQRDLSEYNKKFQQKISHLENKLLLNKYLPDKASGQSMRIQKRKKMSQHSIDSYKSDSSESTSSVDRKNKIQSYMAKGSIGSSVMRQKAGLVMQNPVNKNDSLEDSSKSQSTGKQVDSKSLNPLKLTNSQILDKDNNQLRKIKNHKSSFGDYSTHANQSEKQQGLKKRITIAFQMSQNALKVYETYNQNKKRKHGKVKPFNEAKDKTQSVSSILQ